MTNFNSTNIICKKLNIFSKSFLFHFSDVTANLKEILPKKEPERYVPPRPPSPEEIVPSSSLNEMLNHTIFGSLNKTSYPPLFAPTRPTPSHSQQNHILQNSVQQVMIQGGSSPYGIVVSSQIRNQSTTRNQNLLSHPTSQYIREPYRNSSSDNQSMLDNTHKQMLSSLNKRIIIGPSDCNNKNMYTPYSYPQQGTIIRAQRVGDKIQIVNPPHNLPKPGDIVDAETFNRYQISGASSSNSLINKPMPNPIYVLTNQNDTMVSGTISNSSKATQGSLHMNQLNPGLPMTSQCTPLNYNSSMNQISQYNQTIMPPRMVNTVPIQLDKQMTINSMQPRLILGSKPISSATKEFIPLASIAENKERRMSLSTSMPDQVSLSPHVGTPTIPQNNIPGQIIPSTSYLQNQHLPNSSSTNSSQDLALQQKSNSSLSGLQIISHQNDTNNSSSLRTPKLVNSKVTTYQRSNSSGHSSSKLIHLILVKF